MNKPALALYGVYRVWAIMSERECNKNNARFPYHTISISNSLSSSQEINKKKERDWISYFICVFLRVMFFSPSHSIATWCGRSICDDTPYDEAGDGSCSMNLTMKLQKSSFADSTAGILLDSRRNTGEKFSFHLPCLVGVEAQWIATHHNHLQNWMPVYSNHSSA